SYSVTYFPTIAIPSRTVIVSKFITFPALDLITGDIVLGSPSNAESFPSFALSYIDEADRTIFLH
ncbi:hypothetical protein, partial [Campylobacter jejuni]|uniref:hypothetical protein n=1 Tax=Campylobacter jejuni TaxID=197 RepID=UPI003FA565C9